MKTNTTITHEDIMKTGILLGEFFSTCFTQSDIDILSLGKKLLKKYEITNSLSEVRLDAIFERTHRMRQIVSYLEKRFVFQNKVAAPGKEISEILTPQYQGSQSEFIISRNLFFICCRRSVKQGHAFIPTIRRDALWKQYDVLFYPAEKTIERMKSKKVFSLSEYTIIVDHNWVTKRGLTPDTLPFSKTIQYYQGIIIDKICNGENPFDQSDHLGSVLDAGVTLQQHLVSVLDTKVLKIKRYFNENLLRIQNLGRMRVPLPILVPDLLLLGSRTPHKEYKKLCKDLRRLYREFQRSDFTGSFTEGELIIEKMKSLLSTELFDDQHMRKVIKRKHSDIHIIQKLITIEKTIGLPDIVRHSLDHLRIQKSYPSFLGALIRACEVLTASSDFRKKEKEYYTNITTLCEDFPQLCSCEC